MSPEASLPNNSRSSGNSQSIIIFSSRRLCVCRLWHGSASSAAAFASASGGGSGDVGRSDSNEYDGVGAMGGGAASREAGERERLRLGPTWLESQWAIDVDKQQKTLLVRLTTDV